MVADQGDGPEEGYINQKGQCHENKPADLDRAGKDGRPDSGLNSLHHDTCAVIRESTGDFVCTADGRSLRTVQESVEDRIAETSFVFN